MSGRAQTKAVRDSVEPTQERSEASPASIPAPGGGPTKSGGAAVPRGRRIPSGTAGAGRKDRAAQQHRPTWVAQESAPPYRADASPSPLRGEGRDAVAPLRFIDLFCGIGGFRLAFERAGAKCVFSSDWDRFSQQTYAANFGEKPQALR